VNLSRHRVPILRIGPTTAAELDDLASIIIKPGVMRGCFGSTLSPRLAREILLKEWQACQASPGGVHMVVRCMRHGRPEVAGAGYLLDGELRFFVTPELHRHGLGRALVMSLRGEAERRQLHELSAWVFPENIASARLLESCGFTPGALMQVVTFDRPVLHFGLPLDTTPAHLFGTVPDSARRIGI
jgi:GNAT superfamily N-acetyltransferase